MLKGPYMMSRAFLRSHTAGRPAAIIMTSTIGSYNLPPIYSSYGSSKAALNRITEWIAAENKDDGVQAMAFHPGGVGGTDLTSKSPDWMQRWYTETRKWNSQVYRPYVMLLTHFQPNWGQARVYTSQRSERHGSVDDMWTQGGT